MAGSYFGGGWQNNFGKWLDNNYGLDTNLAFGLAGNAESDSNQKAAWEAYLATMRQDTSQQSQDWLSKQFGRMFGEYTKARAANPLARFATFLGQTDMNKTYNEQGPMQAGRGPSMYYRQRTTTQF